MTETKATAPDSQSRLKAGKEKFEEVMGSDPQTFIDHFKDIAPDYGNYVLEWEFGGLYTRPGLELKIRELVIIASCATLGPAGIPAVKMHINAALRAGATKTEIIEVIMQVSFSAGLPTAMAALEAAKEVFNSKQD